MADVTRPTEEELVAALESSHDQLLIELGQFGVDVGPRDPLDKGMRVYRSLLAQFELTICESTRLRELVEDQAEPLALAGAIADVIAAARHQVPVATLAALLVKSGLLQVCRSYWT